VRAVTAHTERLQRLDQERQAQGTAWHVHPVVEALQARRGVQFTVAVTTVADRGDLPRFDTPRELMKCLGLMPSEYATGERRRQGAITTAGKTHARRALVEGAWAYRYPAKVSRPLPLRLAKQPKVIQAISWKAPGRLCKRDRKLLARGKHANQVVVAIARELMGLMWAIAQVVPVTPSARLVEDHGLSTQKDAPRALAETPPRCWGNPRRRAEPLRADAGRECGRHPTEARKGGANPLGAAGAPVASSWLRLWGCTQGAKHYADLKTVAQHS
jgi:hypothetical protein